MAKVYQTIARTFDAWARCVKNDNQEWITNHAAWIEGIIRDYLPHGSGIDAGVTFDYDNSKPDKLVFLFSYHQMDQSGMYDGWYDYKLIVTPSLRFDFDMRITGRDNNGNKDYFYDIFADCLLAEISK